MALQTAVASPPAAGSRAWTARLRSSLTACGRNAWGVTVGLLFLLAFPLAILLAPLLWVWSRLRDGADDDGAEASVR